MTTVQQIRKRDGRVVPFHENKIADAINKAFQATYKPGYDDTAAKLAHEVASVLEVEGGPCPDVEHIQDIVERPLAEAVLFGPLKNGGKVTVGFNRGKVQLKFPGSEAQGSKKQEALPA